MRDGCTVLGIETSCDETGVAIVRGTELLSDVVASSVAEHARFGGVVPEIASRAHTEALPSAVRRACAEAGVQIGDVDAIAVAAGPGLMGGLLVGAAAAKGLATGLGVPLFGINHLAAHVAVAEIDGVMLDGPTVALLVSGGHTDLLLVRDPVSDIDTLGQTLDDAAGEAFDKVARLLGLPYPGGPSIDAAAREGDSAAITFPRGLTSARDLERHRFDFSFSGLKTAVVRHVEGVRRRGGRVPTADVAAAFQEAAVDVLVSKALDACGATGAGTLVVGGGVAANSRLRHLITGLASERGVTVRIPPRRRCTDNGAMIAWLGARALSAGVEPSGLSFRSISRLPAEQIFVR